MPWRVTPDRGWSWVVLAAACLGQMLTFGLLQSGGVIHLVLLETFHESSTVTSWAGSLFGATLLGAGPLSSWLTSRYGNRRVSMASGVLACVGLIASSQCSNIYQLYVTHGIVTGTSLGLGFAPGMMAVSDYFSARRPLAVGAATCGVSVGVFLYPLLMSHWWQEFGWRGALLVLAGVCLQLCVCGAVYIPALPSGSGKLCERVVTSERKYSNSKAAPKNRESSTQDSFCDIARKTTPAEIIRNISPDVRDVVTADTISSDGDSGVSCSEQCEPIPQIVVDRFQPLAVETTRSNALMLYFNQNLPNVTGQKLMQLPRISTSESNLCKYSDVSYEPSDYYTKSVENLQDTPTHNWKFANAEDCNIEIMCEEMRRAIPAIHGDADNNLTTHAVGKDLYSSCKTPAIVRSDETRLFTDIKFLTLCIHNFLISCGLCIVMLHISAFAKDVARLDDSKNTMIVSVMGGMRLVGSLSVSMLAQYKRFSHATILNTAMIICGIATILCPILVGAYPGLMLPIVVYCSVLGFFTASFAAVVPIILIDVVGIQLVALAYGYIGVIAAIGTLISPPLGGYIYDQTGSYPASFYCGGFFILAGVAVFVAHDYWHSHRMEKVGFNGTAPSPHSLSTVNAEVTYQCHYRNMSCQQPRAAADVWSSHLDIVEAMAAGK